MRIRHIFVYYFKLPHGNNLTYNKNTVATLLFTFKQKRLKAPDDALRMDMQQFLL
jgi:hypothetical protein